MGGKRRCVWLKGPRAMPALAAEASGESSCAWSRCRRDVMVSIPEAIVRRANREFQTAKLTKNARSPWLAPGFTWPRLRPAP